MDYLTYNDVTHLKYTVPRKCWVVIVYHVTAHKNVQNILQPNQFKPRYLWAGTLSNFLGRLWMVWETSVDQWWTVSWFSIGLE